MAEINLDGDWIATKKVKASPRLVLAYRYLGLGPCQTAGESATRSWVRRVAQHPSNAHQKWYIRAEVPTRDIHRYRCAHCSVREHVFYV